MHDRAPTTRILSAPSTESQQAQQMALLSRPAVVTPVRPAMSVMWSVMVAGGEVALPKAPSRNHLNGRNTTLTNHDHKPNLTTSCTDS